MIALDTGALLRYIVEDDAGLAARVEAVLAGDEPVALSSLVLLEAAYALRGAPYSRQNPDVADALIQLLAHANVMLVDMDAELASAAIAGVRHLSARHIADALIAAAASQGGASELLTNDRKFASQLIPVRQLTA